MKAGAARLISTFFHVGFFPFASGTVGSLIGVALYYPVKDSLALHSALIILLFGAGLVSADLYEKSVQKKDPHEVIIDEIACMPVVYLFVPYSWMSLLTGFFLFRAFDVVKPFPIRRLEKLHGGLGIMIDDLAAAIYANILLQIFQRFFF